MADVNVLTLTPAVPQSTDYAVAVRAGAVVGVYADGDDLLDSWYGITGSGDETSKLLTFFEYCVENSKRAVLTKTTYTVSGPILASTSRTGVRRLAVHARVPCTITVDSGATAFDYFIYLYTTAENFVDWSGALVTFDGNSKCGNFLRTSNNGADSTGEAVFNPAPFVKNLYRASSGEANGFGLFGPYRYVYALRPQIDTVSRATTGECSGFTASGFTGEAVVVEPVISRIQCPSGQADADGIKLFGKQIVGDFYKRAGKATVYGGTFTDCQGRNIKFQCSEPAVYRPLSIRQNIVSISQSVDYDFQHGNGVLDAPKFVYKKNGSTSPLGASHSPVAFQQTLGDEDMISVCRDAEMWTEVAMVRFLTVTHFSTSRASITRLTGLRVHQSGFSTQVFTTGIVELPMDTVAAKSYETTVEVTDCKGPFGSYAIAYNAYAGTPSVATLLNIVVRDNVNTITTSMNKPWYASSGSAVRVPKSLLLRNNRGWRSFYGDLDLTINTMVPGCIVTTDLGTCTVTGKPTSWTSGYVTWECKDTYFAATDRTVHGMRLSNPSTLGFTFDGGSNWSYVNHTTS